MTAIIIEDEIPAAHRLSRLLTDRQFTVLHILHSVKSSVKWLQNNAPPDFMFMDIKLRDDMSFRIFDKITISSRIIFTTAYDDFALKAFEYNSIAYLLKPIDFQKLDMAIAKIRLSDKALAMDLKSIEKIIDEKKHSFLVTAGNSIKKISVDEITYFESEQNSSYMITSDRKFPLGHSLEKIENLVSPRKFFRIHRKYIVNRDFISEVAFDGMVIIAGGFDSEIKLPISRLRLRSFMEWYQE